MKTKLTVALTAFLLTAAVHTANAQSVNWRTAGNNVADGQKLGSNNNRSLLIVTDSTQRMIIDSIGNITMGLNAGPSKFLFFGTSFWMKFPNSQYIFRHSNSQEGLYFNQPSQRIEYRDQVAVPNMWVQWASTGNAYFRGNVGIGTETPGAKLHLNSSVAGEIAKFNGGANSMYMGLYENGSYRGYIGSYSGNNEDVDFGTGGGTTGKLHLTIQANPRLTIDNTGRVGINTTTPEANLHVFRGSAGTVTANANAPLVVENSTSNYINLLTPSANERGILFGDNLNNSDGGIIYVGSNNSMQFRTDGNVTRMALTSIGDLGLGTLSPSRKLQIQDGDMRLSRSTSTARYLEFVSTVAAQNDVRMEHNSSGSSLYFSASDNDFGSFTDLARFDLASSPTYVFTIYGSGLASGGIWQDSDAKLKKDINDFSSAMDIVKQLKPKTYFFKTNEYKKLNLPAEKQYGFIAQDLEKVLPELVKTSQQPTDVDASGERKTEEIKAVNYSELIPILTKAIQEQQKEIDELKEIVKQLAGGQSLSTVNSAASKTTNAVVTDAVLEQNKPNPLTSNTSIRYSIPGGAKNAQLIITDLAGKTVKQIALNNATAGTVNIDASMLGSGTYNYTLYADGKIIGSKKMIVNR